MWPFKRKNLPQPVSPIVTPPVDLNQPVENPNVKAAIAALGAVTSADTRKALWQELNRANYLVIFKDDELNITYRAEGQATLHPGGLIKVMTCRSPQGEQLLPAFTDWQEVNAFTGGEKVATLVTPSQDLWAMVLDGTYEGAVINPSGTPLQLSREQLQGLKQ